jgi:hypothetical protein
VIAEGDDREMESSRSVTTAAELAEALAAGIGEIRIEGAITGSPMITVPPGVCLRGSTLRFGAKGVRLTADNTLDGVTVETADHEVAILNDTSVGDLGTLTLRNVRTRGQVLLVAEDAVRPGTCRSRGCMSSGPTGAGGRVARTGSGSRRCRAR